MTLTTSMVIIIIILILYIIYNRYHIDVSGVWELDKSYANVMNIDNIILYFDNDDIINIVIVANADIVYSNTVPYHTWFNTLYIDDDSDNLPFPNTLNMKYDDGQLTLSTEEKIYLVLFKNNEDTYNAKYINKE